MDADNVDCGSSSGPINILGNLRHRRAVSWRRLFLTRRPRHLDQVNECLRGGTFEWQLPSPIEASSSARLSGYVVRPPKLDEPNLAAISIVVEDILSYYPPPLPTSRWVLYIFAGPHSDVGKGEDSI
jgi:hypothetical protein